VNPVPKLEEEKEEEEEEEKCAFGDKQHSLTHGYFR
jgi:hypothetical protein